MLKHAVAAALTIVSSATWAADAHFEWGQSNSRYWMLFGADQLVHQLTYLLIVVLLIQHTLN